MLGWVKVLKKKFNKMSMLGQIVSVALIVLVTRYLLHKIIYSNYLSSYLENFGTPKKMIYFHMDGCGHCKKFTPVWERFTSQYKGNVQLEKLERKEAGNMLEKYNVQGFPTVIKIDDQGQHKEFDGERTVEELNKFAN